MRTNRNRPNFGVLLLLYQIFGAIGIDNIPPVTCFLVGLQVVIYLRLVNLPWYQVSDACVSVQSVWYAEEWERLIFGALEHIDDMHLYYNMISFVWKGQLLERMLGKLKFLYIVFVFTILTNVILVALSFGLTLYIDSDYRYQCSAGFSGVIFALKVLTNYWWPMNNYNVFGISFPTSYAVWAELVIIQLLTPNVSFAGHLAGIIVGLLYVKGPLKVVMDIPEKILKSFSSPSQPRWSYASPRNTNTYTSSSQYSHEGNSEFNGHHPSSEELRTRRLYRFGNSSYR